jgi:Fe-Mn family superoxide dismutase
MFKQKELPYPLDALEPVISKELMDLHYNKHHKAYTDNFNIAIQENNLEGKSLDEIFANILEYPKSVENHGGGYFNHQFF